MKTLLSFLVGFAMVPFIAYSQNPAADSITLDPTPILYKMQNSEDSLDQLKGISLLFSYFADTGNDKKLTEIIENYSNSRNAFYPGRVLCWLGRYHTENGNYKLALSEFELVQAKHDRERFNDYTWGEYALDSKAEVYCMQGDFKQAIIAYNDLIKRYPGSNHMGGYKHKLAMTYKASGDYKKSKEVLTDMARNYGKSSHPYLDETLSETSKQLINEIDRYASNGAFGSSTSEELISKLRVILDKKDIEALGSLVKSNNFWWTSLGTEPTPYDISSFKDILDAAFMAGSPVISEPFLIKRHKEKLYVHSSGWKSKYMSEELWFVLKIDFNRWYLQGIVLTDTRPVPGTLIKESESESTTGQSESVNFYASLSGAAAPLMEAPQTLPLRFTLLAPWKGGTYMSSGKNPSMFCGNNCANLCGWNGYYYGEGGHTGRHYYAIDFTYWTNSFPQAGRNVLSVATGIVDRVNSDNGQVWIRHLGCGGVGDGYTSTYAHMRNIRVATGQYVARGSWIGEVDDVGNSTGSHLHFVLYDSQNSGNSVKTSPLDGQARNEKGVSRCIKSTNSSIWSDSDGDGIPNVIDNCPTIPNHDQRDGNSNCQGDACEDRDMDGIWDLSDNCPNKINPDQSDLDADNLGDECDVDIDGDLVECVWNPIWHRWVCNEYLPDNCEYVQNPDQLDFDGDGIGDACDDDIDNDGIVNEFDNCPYLADARNSDIDFDNVGDACDNCPGTYNPDQSDVNHDGEGNACDEGDTDNDGIPDMNDNCPEVCNSDQLDNNEDGIGNACTTWDLEVPVIPDNRITAVRDMIDLAIKFESMGTRFPIVVGPICTSCPTFQDLMVEIIIHNYSNELNYQVFTRYGNEVPTAISNKGNRMVLSSPVNPRSEYFLIISPSVRIDLNKTYKIKLELNGVDKYR